MEIAKNVFCDLTDPNNPTATYDTTDVMEFREYEGFFDDFNCDIGHGKGSGENGTDKGHGHNNRELSIKYDSHFGDW